jgi:hypothetical protein
VISPIKDYTLRSEGTNLTIVQRPSEDPKPIKNKNKNKKKIMIVN